MENRSLDSSMNEKSTLKLESMLKELVSYTHPGDMSDMSPEVQTLLRHDEESQAREEETRHASRRLKGRRPRERRRGRDSEPTVTGCTHAGGSLDNIAAETCSGDAAGKRKGVAGRTAEGGSCFNLSRGSFEPALRRQRQQQGGSLEDLGAIDESAAGLETAKSSGSLQNLSQQLEQQQQQQGQQSAAAAVVEMTEMTEAPDRGGETAAARPDAGGAVVIQMADEADDSGDDTAARLAVRALAAPCTAEEAPERGTSLQERPRHTLSLEEGGGVLQAAAAAAATGGAGRQTAGETELKQTKKPSAAAAVADRRSDLRFLNLGQSYTIEEFNASRDERMAARRGQTLDGGGGSSSGTTGSGPGSRHENSRQRKNRKKPETTVTTDSVANYQGRNDVDDLIKFIESGGSKPAVPPDKSGRKTERAGRRDKGRRSGEERAGRQGARAARRPAAKPAAPAAARSSSLETRPAAGESTADHSRLCGDLAQPRAASPAAAAPAALALWARDGVTYVSAAPAAAGDEFVRDFYSVTDEVGVPEESEFHVVTRKQRRRPAARAGYGYGAAQETASRTSGPPSWRPSRAGASGRAALSARSVTNSEETSDADSDGAASAPAAGRPPLSSDSGVASAASSSNSAASSASSASSACSISSPSPGFSASSSAAASWADVAKPKAADVAAAQTDFIDGVGAIFGDRSPAHATQSPSLVRGDAESLEARIGGAHPDEFPAIPMPIAAPAVAAAAAVTPTSTSAAAAAPAPAAVPAAASGVSVVRSPAAAAPLLVQATVVTVAAPQVNGGPPPSAAVASGRNRRSPAVEIPATVLPGDAAGSESRLKMPDIQFGYIDTSETEAPAAAAAAATTAPPEPESKAAPTGVDGFCRRFRSQPVDVSQFNWREVSVFLSKVYAEAEAVRVSAAPRELPCTQRL